MIKNQEQYELIKFLRDRLGQLTKKIEDYGPSRKLDHLNHQILINTGKELISEYDAEIAEWEKNQQN